MGLFTKESGPARLHNYNLLITAVLPLISIYKGNIDEQVSAQCGQVWHSQRTSYNETDYVGWKATDFTKKTLQIGCKVTGELIEKEFGHFKQRKTDRLNAKLTSYHRSIGPQWFDSCLEAFYILEAIALTLS